jgi:hypothetical protein
MRELRYDLHGRCAVRVEGGGVLGPHVVAAPPDAPWVIEARCGTARGWLLGAAAPDDPEGEAARLEAEVLRRTAAARERQVLALAALDAELLERLTHRLRTDVMTLATVAEGALDGVFADEAAAVVAELRRTSRDAQRRITAAREVMSVLDGRTGAPEPVAATLRAELEGAGRAARVTVTGGEDAWTTIGGAGWAACARLLASDERWTAFVVAPDEGGWRVTATAGTAGGLAGDAGRSAPGAAGGSAGVSAPFARAAHLVVAAGGHATAAALVVPAAVAR